MSLALDEFIADARAVSIEDAAKMLDLKFRQRGHEHPQPCPQCGGRDRFSFNTEKKMWNCRHAAVGGRDAIGMVAHCRDYDLRRRDGFMEVCSILTGRQIPEGGERESEEERTARLDRIEAARRRADEEATRHEADQLSFREKERQKARGIYEASLPLFNSPLGFGRWYLERRGAAVPESPWLRISADQPYWHGQDERGQLLVLHSGPAMVAPFIGPDCCIIGCHITWIDLGNPPKFRPALYGLTKEGMAAGLVDWAVGDPSPSPDDLAAELYQILPTKKMRGSKKGGLIPLAGDLSARRWVGGEAIENGLAFANWEGFRADTFYFAAGDLGNLSGSAEPSSRFAHPSLTKLDKKGVARPVMIAGPVPKEPREPDDAMFVHDHVDELVLLADGDSEKVMTAAAMARSRARHARPGRTIPVVWPRAGYDFARMAAEAQA